MKSQAQVREKCSTGVSNVFANQNFAEKYRSSTPSRTARYSKENQRPLGFEQKYKDYMPMKTQKIKQQP